LSSRVATFRRGRAGIDQVQIAGIARAQRREIIDRYVVFAAGRAQGEQPLLDALELGRIVVGCCKRALKIGPCLVEGGEGLRRSAHRRCDQSRRLPLPALQPAHGGRQRRDRRGGARNSIQCVAQIGRDLLALHHHGPAFGERSLLARFGRELGELGHRVAQELGFALRALDLALMLGDSGLGLPSCLPQSADLRALFVEAAERVEQRTVG
jgi:hypothetical protein